MLIWVCALHCEAKPVIDFYRLKKSHDNNAFDIYLGQDMVCVISGIGKLASASATAWIAAQFQTRASLVWINLGTAGSSHQPLGSAYRLNQIIDSDTGQRYYPATTVKSSLAGSGCITISRESDDYHPDFLQDMEASGFIHAALRFSTCEMLASIKIVSDNPSQQTGKQRQMTSDLIQQNMSLINGMADALLELDSELDARGPDRNFCNRITSATHFSQTQKKRLQVLCHYLLNRNYEEEGLLQNLSSITSAGEILDTLEQLSHSDAARLES